jgi:hypothetical protein
VPAGLTIYWLTNNVLTTAQQLYLKKVTKIELPKARGTIVNPVIDVEASPSGSEASAGARRSRKGETFRARQVCWTDSYVIHFTIRSPMYSGNLLITFLSFSSQRWQYVVRSTANDVCRPKRTRQRLHRIQGARRKERSLQSVGAWSRTRSRLIALPVA